LVSPLIDHLNSIQNNITSRIQAIGTKSQLRTGNKATPINAGTN